MSTKLLCHTKVKTLDEYFKLDNSEIPTRKTYYYNAADTNPVYFYGNNVSAIDLEFSKVIQSGNYYIYNHNDNFEEVKYEDGPLPFVVAYPPNKSVTL